MVAVRQKTWVAEYGIASGQAIVAVGQEERVVGGNRGADQMGDDDAQVRAGNGVVDQSKGNTNYLLKRPALLCCNQAWDWRIQSQGVL